MKKAFTLIELIIVIAIISILTTIIIYNVIGAQAKSRDAKRKSDIKAISVALESYKAQKGKYPKPCKAQGSEDLSGRPSAKIDQDQFGCSGISGAAADGTIKELLTQGYIANVPLDPVPDTLKGYIYKTSPDFLDYKLIANNVEYLPNSGNCQEFAAEYYDPANGGCADYQVSSNSETTKNW